ncbi:hypothetical protein C4J81_17865 [Deltaproteobacteria bacterium Smac51]|nr:hypothetical protein C4J81_17865 [Deltaproteobacteria bacterium Smac51]
MNIKSADLKQVVTTRYGLSEDQFADLESKVLEKAAPGRMAMLDDNFVANWMASKGLATPEKRDTPELAQPPVKNTASQTEALRAFTAVPSPTAAIMAMITETAADQRRINKEMIVDEANRASEKMLDQAQEMRSKGAAMLAIGIVSGTLSLAAAGFSVGMAAKAPAKPQALKDSVAGVEGNAAGDTLVEKFSDKMGQAKESLATKFDSIKDKFKSKSPAAERSLDGAEELDMLEVDLDEPARPRPAEAAEAQPEVGRPQPNEGELTTIRQLYGAELAHHATFTEGISGAFQSLVKMMDSGSGLAGSNSDARVKGLESEIETIRGSVESLKSLNQSFSDLISKVLSAADSIQQTMNQTRAKILG